MDYIRVVIQSNYNVLIFLPVNHSNSCNDDLRLQQIIYNIIQQMYYAFNVDNDNGIKVIQHDDNNYDPYLDLYTLYNTNSTTTNTTTNPNHNNKILQSTKILNNDTTNTITSKKAIKIINKKPIIKKIITISINNI